MTEPVEIPVIICPCGFKVTNVSEQAAVQAHKHHECSLIERQVSWIEHLFSTRGVILCSLAWIVLFAAIVVTEVAKNAR